jgi:hypothetical protein
MAAVTACTIVTKEYAKRKKLKKLGSNIPVVSFGSPDTKMGDLYEVPLRASGRRRISVCAVSVVVIYNELLLCACITSRGNSCSPEEPMPGTCISLEEPLPSASVWTTPS